MPSFETDTCLPRKQMKLRWIKLITHITDLRRSKLNKKQGVAQELNTELESCQQWEKPYHSSPIFPPVRFQCVQVV